MLEEAAPTDMFLPFLIVSAFLYIAMSINTSGLVHFVCQCLEIDVDEEAAIDSLLALLSPQQCVCNCQNRKRCDQLTTAL